MQRSAKSLAAEQAFRARVAELGGRVVGEWNGSNQPVAVVCREGHACAPHPGSVRGGRGICRACAGKDPLAAEAAFRARVAELGGRIVGEWNGTKRPVAVVCREGHACAPHPSNVLRGRGICRTCAGKDSLAAETAFRARVAELGGQVVGEWNGTKRPVAVVCREGHACAPHPSGVLGGNGFCRTCAGNDTLAAETAFRARVAELGGRIVGEWNGSDQRAAVVCREGHACTPHPGNVLRGHGICRTCAGQDSLVAEATFRARVAELGGRVVGKWNGTKRPVAVVCREGHACAPHPSSVLGGNGICRICKGKAWDAFYVVADDVNDHIKLGITSGDPRPRLGDHERDGFDRVIRLMTNLPGTTAPDMERAAIGALNLAGVRPVRGREYFDRSALALVLDIVDNYPIQVRTT